MEQTILEQIFDFSDLDVSDLRPLTQEEHEMISRAIENDDSIANKIDYAMASYDKYIASVSGQEVGYVPPHLVHEYILRKILTGSELLPLPDNTDLQQNVETKRYDIERTPAGRIKSYEELDKNMSALEVDMINVAYDNDHYKYIIDTEFGEFVNEEDNLLNIMQAEIDDLRSQLATAKAQINATKNIRDISSRESQRSKKALDEANAAIEDLAKSLQEQQEEIAKQVEEQQSKAAEELQKMIDDLLAKIESNDVDISELEAIIANLEGQVEALSKDDNSDLLKGLDAIKSALGGLKNDTNRTTSSKQTTGESTTSSGESVTEKPRNLSDEYEIGKYKVRFDTEGPYPESNKLTSTQTKSKTVKVIVNSSVINKEEESSLSDYRNTLKRDLDFYTDKRTEYNKAKGDYLPGKVTYNIRQLNKVINGIDGLISDIDNKLNLSKLVGTPDSTDATLDTSLDLSNVSNQDETSPANFNSSNSGVTSGGSTGNNGGTGGSNGGPTGFTDVIDDPTNTSGNGRSSGGSGNRRNNNNGDTSFTGNFG